VDEARRQLEDLKNKIRNDPSLTRDEVATYKIQLEQLEKDVDELDKDKNISEEQTDPLEDLIDGLQSDVRKFEDTINGEKEVDRNGVGGGINWLLDLVGNVLPGGDGIKDAARNIGVDGIPDDLVNDILNAGGDVGKAIGNVVGDAFDWIF
jgi:hypothetical protein